MQPDLKISNIHINGQFDVSTYDRHFFISNKIFDADKIKVQPNGNFNLITCDNNAITLSKSSIVIATIDPSVDDHSANIAKLIFENNKSPNNMVKNMGINFGWFITFNNKQELAEFTKENFYNENNKMHKNFFSTEDSIYGFYASKNLKKSRLKMDVKGVVVFDSKTQQESDAVSFIFNFHFDFENSTSSDEVVAVLGDSRSYYEESKNIVSLYSK